MEGLDSVLGATGIGAVLGGILTWISQARKESHERQLALIEEARKNVESADASADRAAARDTTKVGSAIRQFIIISLVFSFVFAPFILCWFNVPMAVEYTETKGGYLWGLIPEYTKYFVEYVKGFYIPAEFKTAFMAIVGFYFGRSACK